MVLSEGKGVGAGKPSSMPSSGLPGQTTSFSHSHSCPCRQTLGPGPVHTFTLGDAEPRSSPPRPDPGSGLQAPALAGLALPLAED